MQYRTLGMTGLEVSILGFGAMRLPTKPGRTISVDTDETVRIIRHAIDEGVNLVDTAWSYHNGESETAVAGALADGYRDKVILQTKNPTWLLEKPEDYDDYLDKQLEKLRTDSIDSYLFHSLSKKNFESKVRALDLVARAERARDAGKIRHVCFSFHDDAANLRELVDAGIGEAMLVQYNLLDRSNEETMAYAADRGMGVMIMGPVGGGRLATPPSEVLEKARADGREMITATDALTFVWSNPAVGTALSGMGSMDDVEENLRAARDFKPLTPEESAELERILARNKELGDSYCTLCGYCTPCPEGVNIPLIFELMNYHRVYKAEKYARETYKLIGFLEMFPGKRADACTECGECEPKCPQGIPIIEQLKEAAGALGEE
ncbi:MAG: aldo/keto reductase [Candidatus Coatesbacteria bacterium]|nr:MAG: aldo/keto reductase [Candidatus Coatesbacteria bacterium]